MADDATVTGTYTVKVGQPQCQRVGWECPRCRAIHSPDDRTCSCSIANNHPDWVTPQYPYMPGYYITWTT